MFTVWKISKNVFIAFTSQSSFMILSRYALFSMLLLLSFYDNASIVIHISIFFHVRHSIFRSVNLSSHFPLKLMSKGRFTLVAFFLPPSCRAPYMVSVCFSTSSATRFFNDAAKLKNFSFSASRRTRTIERDIAFGRHIGFQTS